MRSQGYVILYYLLFVSPSRKEAVGSFRWPRVKGPLHLCSPDRPTMHTLSYFFPKHFYFIFCSTSLLYLCLSIAKCNLLDVHNYTWIPRFFFDTLLSLAFVSFTLDTFCIFSNKLSHHQDYYDHEPFFIPLIKNYYY